MIKNPEFPLDYDVVVKNGFFRQEIKVSQIHFFAMAKMGVFLKVADLGI